MTARLWSWAGIALAALYALVFVALYIDYARRAGEWFADLQLALAALPFTLAMRWISGGAYAFGGEMTGRVVAAGLFGAALAYGLGLVLETLARAAAAIVWRR